MVPIRNSAALQMHEPRNLRELRKPCTRCSSCTAQARAPFPQQPMQTHAGSLFKLKGSKCRQTSCGLAKQDANRPPTCHHALTAEGLNRHTTQSEPSPPCFGMDCRSIALSRLSFYHAMVLGSGLTLVPVDVCFQSAPNLGLKETVSWCLALESRLGARVPRQDIWATVDMSCTPSGHGYI